MFDFQSLDSTGMLMRLDTIHCSNITLQESVGSLDVWPRWIKKIKCKVVSLISVPVVVVIKHVTQNATANSLPFEKKFEW